MTATTLAAELGDLLPEYGGELAAALLALPPDRRAELAAELLDVETLAAAIHSTPDELTGPGEGDPCLACSDQAAAILAALRSPP